MTTPRSSSNLWDHARLANRGRLAVRCMNGVSAQLPVSNLPDLPRAPPYPCPFLTEEETDTYLEPLYARAWVSQDYESSHKSTLTKELAKRFTFPDTQALGRFLQDLKVITDSENHHALQDVSQDPPSVIIKVHTHSALRPASYAEEPRRARVQPGITLRDVRFAYLVEERYSTYAT
ncbi:hypothetical protein C8Q79DRAFT_498317 [Trametes meyenii]|nr:hypothetical protein C8Q79DRAFT_498317 [Trametes meyenii]